MTRLPVIVGLGGVNAAGRTSAHHGYRRMVLDALPAAQRQETLLALATMMKLVRYDESGTLAGHDGRAIDPQDIEQRYGDHIRHHTLLRRIEPEHFDPLHTPWQQRMQLQAGELRFRVRAREMPSRVPDNWQVRQIDDSSDVEVVISGTQEILVPDTHESDVSSAGMLPTGFAPASLYAARNHPRGLQLTVFAASDALNSLGVEWETIRQHVAPDRIGVYASSAHGQLDDAGFGGMVKAPWQGKRTSSKQCPLGFAEMPADFVNAYVLGSVGVTNGILGACATLLYNLERALDDIQSGRVAVALVGAVEAPILPEIMEGYRAMGALGTDADLLALDQAKGRTTPDHTRATRPFGNNIGFTIAEAGHFFVLTSDELAIELGLSILGSVPGTYVHADGFKKSISSPGIGNYLTLGKAASLAQSILGEDALKQRTYIQAHGTGTPQNRVTESHVFEKIAEANDISNWLVSSVKCYVGHSLGAAAGDQLGAALGAWEFGHIPGIFTLDQIADDVYRSHLDFRQQHTSLSERPMDACFINSKGFGGNNATALVLSPERTRALLKKRHGEANWLAYEKKNALVREQSAANEAGAAKGDFRMHYHFGEHVASGYDLTISGTDLSIPGHPGSVALKVKNPFGQIG